MTGLPDPILIVDDDPEVRASLVEALAERNFTAEAVDGAGSALESIRLRHYAVVITDLNMPGGPSGLELLGAIKGLDPLSVCVVLTGYATLEGAIKSLQHGAYDFIQKPFTLNQIEMVVSRALEHARLQLQVREYQTELERKVMGRTQDLKSLYQEALALCDLTAASQRMPGQGSMALFMEHLQARWQPDGLGFYVPGNGGWRLVYEHGPRKLPSGLGALDVGWEGQLGYPEAHGVMLSGSGPRPFGALAMGYEGRSAFSPMDPDFVLFLRHLELALGGAGGPVPDKVAS
ncbi:MAG TPA: response regulator [Holophagaceae bacterium]|nr:response regulator [Holophagaceae bacterium]